MTRARISGLILFLIAACAQAETLYYFKAPKELDRVPGIYVRRTSFFEGAGFELVVGNFGRDVGYSTPAYRDDLGGLMYPTSKIFLALTAQATAADVARLIPGEVLLADAWGINNLFLVETHLTDGVAVLNLAAEISTHSIVRYCHPDMVMSGRTNLTPNDALFNSQWHLRNVASPNFDTQADLAWDQTTGSNEVLAVVIDNGVQDNHPDLPLSLGATFTGQVGNGTPTGINDNHGTFVAGCIGATLNNTIGLCGIAPGVRVGSAKPHQMVNANGFNVQVSWFVAALDWARNQGARVTCNSNNYGTAMAAITDIYTSTYADGMVHFAAVGNSGASVIGFPASAPNINAVMAIASNGVRSPFSQFGVGTDFAAPGTGIWTTDRTGSAGSSATDYVSVNGTSFATPLAAGVCALALSANPLLTPTQLEILMQATAFDRGTAGYDTTYGYGLVNADAAVDAALAIRWNGTVTFGDWQGPSPAEVQMGFDLPGTLVDRSVSTPLAIGSFDAVAPKGGFSVRVSRRPWLARRFSLNNSGVLSFSFSLTNGDADGSGEVDAADIDFIISRFGGTSLPMPDLYADLDGSGEVDAADIDVAIANFGATADP